MPIWLNRSPESPTAQPQKSVLKITKTKDAVCAVLAQCDVREPKTVAQRAPLKTTRISHRVNHVAASHKESAAHKVKLASMVSKAIKGSKADTSKVARSQLSLDQGRPIVAG